MCFLDATKDVGESGVHATDELKQDSYINSNS